MGGECPAAALRSATHAVNRVMTVLLGPFSHMRTTDSISEWLHDASQNSKIHLASRGATFPTPVKSSSRAHQLICLDWLGAVGEGAGAADNAGDALSNIFLS